MDVIGWFPFSRLRARLDPTNDWLTGAGCGAESLRCLGMPVRIPVIGSPMKTKMLFTSKWIDGKHVKTSFLLQVKIRTFPTRIRYVVFVFAVKLIGMDVMPFPFFSLCMLKLGFYHPKSDSGNVRNLDS